MRRPSKLNAIVGAFEKTIGQNKEYNRTLSTPDKICYGGGNLRGFRRSVSYSVVPTKAKPQEKQRRATFLVPEKVVEPSSPTTPSTKEQQETKSSPDKPPSNIDSLPEKSEIKTAPKPPSSSLPPEPTQETESKPLPPSKNAQAKPRHSKKKVEEDPLEEDDEIMALMRQIAELETKLSQTESDEKSQIEAIDRKTQERKAHYRDSRITKSGLCESEKERSLLMLNTKEQSKELEKHQMTTKELRKANKAMRKEQDKLAANIRSFAADNARLKHENVDMQVHLAKVSAFRDNQEKTYSTCIERVPQYRQRLEEFRAEGDRRDSMIQAEKQEGRRYSHCTSKIVTMLRSHCDDKELVSILKETTKELEEDRGGVKSSKLRVAAQTA